MEAKINPGALGITPAIRKEKCKRRVPRSHRTTISLGGLDFLLGGAKVLGVSGFNLSQKAIDAISERVVLFDEYAYGICQDKNRAYDNPPVDIAYIERLNARYDKAFADILDMNAQIRKTAEGSEPSTLATSISKTSKLLREELSTMK